MKIKEFKKCKNCGKEFKIYATTDKFCSKKCMNELEKEKKAKVREKKKVSISVLTKLADKLASEYIRKRDCLLTTGTLTHGICITCGERKEYSQFDCGHFITRANRNTRWDEKNMSLQCKACNCWGGGRQYEHGIALDKKWGQGTAQELLKKSKQIIKLTNSELLEIINFYKKELAKINNSI